MDETFGKILQLPVACCIASSDASVKRCEHFAFTHHLFHKMDLFIIVSEVHTIKDFTDVVGPRKVVYKSGSAMWYCYLVESFQ
jgi:cytosine/uracil/thiamine/allantoin permease